MTAFIAWLSHLLGWDADLPTKTDPLMPVPPRETPRETVEPNANTLPESEHPNALKLVLAAKQCLGKDLSAGTGVPSYVACALSVNRVVALALGESIGGGASTFELYKAIQKDARFKEVPVEQATPGTILICPTGMGSKAAFPHGHCGIMANYGICANDSATGLWSETYADLTAWRQQFETIEGFPTYAFAPV